MPLAHASTLDRCDIAAVARLRGGVLEPGARVSLEIRRQKQPSNIQRQLPRSAGRGPFSLRRGLDSVLGFLTLSITSLVLLICLQTTKATPLGVALASSCYAARGLAGAPPSEGLAIAGPQQAEGPLSARRAGRDIGRGRAE